MTVPPSRTNGFLFADLRGYTRYVETHGDHAAAALLETYRALVRAAVVAFAGAEIRTEGDSFFIVFPSASSAVQCGVSIVHAAAITRERGIPIDVGVGIHAGETVETAEGYVGSAVNVASRVCSQARAGEVLVTETVRALTRTVLPVRFTDRRTRRLKGVAEPIVLYRVEPVPEGTAAATAGTRFRVGRGTPAWAVGRTHRVAIVLVGLLIGGAASAYLLVSAQRPSLQPSGSPLPIATGPATSEPSPAPTFPNRDEADLLAQVPARFRDTCVRTAEPDERIGSVASLKCELGLGSEADVVWYDRFASLFELSGALFAIIDARSLPFAECGVAVPRAQGNWQVGTTHSGQALCFEDDGSNWIVWSYDADRIAARAVRSGVGPEDWIELYEWWREVRLFLR